MLYCVCLFFAGSWQQTLINLDNKAPATGLSSGWFYYGVGVFFSVSAAVLLLRNLWQAVTGKIAERDLIQVRESEDEAKEPSARRARPNAARRRRPTGDKR